MSVKGVKHLELVIDRLNKEIDNINSKIYSSANGISNSALKVLLDTRTSLLYKKFATQKKIELLSKTGKEYGDYIEGKNPN